MSRPKVAVLYTRPETVLEDYQRLFALAGGAATRRTRSGKRPRGVEPGIGAAAGPARAGRPARREDKCMPEEEPPRAHRHPDDLPRPSCLQTSLPNQQCKLGFHFGTLQVEVRLLGQYRKNECLSRWMPANQ